MKKNKDNYIWDFKTSINSKNNTINLNICLNFLKNKLEKLKIINKLNNTFNFNIRILFNSYIKLKFKCACIYIEFENNNIEVMGIMENVKYYNLINFKKYNFKISDYRYYKKFDINNLEKELNTFLDEIINIELKN